MSNKVTYDFSLDSIVAIDAPIGTDPDTLVDQCIEKLINLLHERDVTFSFENVFDSETGDYDIDWENYSKEIENA